MELLLTPVVNRILSRFIKKLDDGTPGSQLRARLSGGSVVLHDLELNLDSALEKLPIEVHRAFAKELRLTIGWTALASQPIQVELDSVEVVIQLNEDKRHSADTPRAKQEGSASWLGSVTSLLLRTLFDTSLVVKNLVVKAILPSCVAELRIARISLVTVADGWQRHLKQPENWLKKALKLTDISFGITSSTAERPGLRAAESLLAVQSLDVTALTPIFAIIEDQHNIGQPLECQVEVSVGRVDSMIPQYQVPQLAELVETALRQKRGRQQGDEVETSDLSPDSPMVQRRSLEAADAEWRRLRRAAELNGAPLTVKPCEQTPSSGWLTSVSTGVANAWSFITDEAALADVQAPPPSVPRPRPTVSLDLSLTGGSVVLKAAEAPTGGKEEGHDDDSHTLLAVSWSDFYGSMLHNGDEFTAADLSIGQVSTRRQLMYSRAETLGQPVLDEVVGIYQCEEVESSMLIRERNVVPCAIRLIWQKGRQDITEPQQTVHDRISIAIGRFSASYPAGLLTDLALFFGRGQAPGNVKRTPTAKSKSSGAQSSLASRIPSLLKQSVDLDFAILSLHVSLLSSREPGTEALSVSVYRLSTHLGGLKSTTRPGSVSASMQALLAPAQPPRGFRISVVGIELGVSTIWVPTPERRDSGLPEVSKAICRPIECQAVVVADRGHDSSAELHPEAIEDLPSGAQTQASPDAARYHLAVGALKFRVTQRELAALLSVVAGVKTELERKFVTALPRPTHASPSMDDSHKAVQITFQAPAIALAASSHLGALSIPSGHFLSSAARNKALCVSGLPGASLAICASEDQDDERQILVEMSSIILLCSPGLELSIPRVIARLEGQPKSAAEEKNDSGGGSILSTLLGSHTTAEIQPASKGTDEPFLTVTHLSLHLGVRANTRQASVALQTSKPESPGTNPGPQVQLVVQEVALSFLDQSWSEFLCTVAALRAQLEVPASSAQYPSVPRTEAQQSKLAIDMGTIRAALPLDAGRGGLCEDSACVLEAKGISTLLEILEKPAGGNQVDLASPSSRKRLSLIVTGVALAADGTDILRLQPCPGHEGAMDLTLESCTTASDSSSLSALVSASTVELDLTAEQLQSIINFLALSKAILHRGSPYQASHIPAADRKAKPASARGKARLSCQLDVAGCRVSLWSKVSSSHKIGLELRTGAASFSVREAEPVFFGFPSARLLNGSLKDISLLVLCPGMSKSVILVPSFDASMSAKRVLVDPCHESCLLTIPYLRMVVTPLSIHTIARLAQNFRTALGSGKHPRDESQQAHTEAELPAKPKYSKESVVFRSTERAFSPPGDDLRSGLFELTPTLGTRPDPMQIGFGDKQPGALSWTGVGESWICWNYCSPRKISSILITLPQDLVHASELELLGYDDKGDDFTNIEIDVRKCTVASAEAEMVLITIKAQASFQEWQICWECPTDRPPFTASHMLRHLYVNADLGWVEEHVEALPVPRTIGLSVGQLKMHVDAEVPGKTMAEQLAAVQLQECKVAAHLWKNAKALRVAAGLQLQCIDNVSLLEYTLASCDFLSILLESRSLEQRQDHQESAHIYLSRNGDSICDPVPSPSRFGMHGIARFANGPLLFRASELGCHALVQNSEILQTSLKAARIETQGSGGHQGEAGIRGPAICLENRSGSHLLLSQLGSESWFEVPDGLSTAFTWQALPSASTGVRRLMCIRAAQALQSNVLSNTQLLDLQGKENAGGQNSGGLQRRSTPGARSSGFKESVFDAMSQGASLREAEFDNGQRALITVHCFQHKLGWKVVFLPGCSITNHSDMPLTVSTVTPRPREASGDLASPRLTTSPRTASESAWNLHTKEQQVMQISPDDGCSRHYLPVLKLNRAARTPLSVSTLRVWLGRGNGWSIPFILYSTQTQTQNLAPAGVEGMSPRVPEHRALNRSPGSLIAVLQPMLGGLHLAIWPSYRVSSDLPIPVQWRVNAPDFASEALGVQASQIVETNLGSEKPLNCLRGSQASLSIALGTKAAACQSGKESWSTQLSLEPGTIHAQRWGTVGENLKALPLPGQSKLITVPYNKSTLKLLLCSEPYSQEKPSVHLRVVAHCCIQNCSDMRVEISFLDGEPIVVQPQQSALGDLSSMRAFPRQAILSALHGSAKFTSKPFELEAGDHYFALHSSPSEGSETDAVGLIGMIHAAVRVDRRRHAASENTLPETLMLTVTPGLVCTNLMAHDLLLQPRDATKDSSAAVKVESEQTASLPWVWQKQLLTNLRRKKSSSDKSSTDGLDDRIEMRVGVFDPGGVRSREEQLTTLDLQDTESRQRISLMCGGCSVLVTCRVLARRGRRHIVLFQDRQPPVVLQNNMPTAIEVGYFLPESNKLGEVHYEIASRIWHIKQAESVECDLRDRNEPGRSEPGEDEDAFLEHISGAERKQMPYLGKLRYRLSSNDCWSAVCPVLCGEHSIDNMAVSISSSCATIYCAFGSSFEQQSTAHLQLPMSLCVEAENLQISIVEDERLRWLGLSESSLTASELAKLPAELFCLRIRQMRLNAGKLPSGGGHLEYSVQLGARDLDIANFLAGTSTPYLCSALPARTYNETQQLSAIHLELVATSRLRPAGVCNSFRNTWIQKLILRMPALAVTVDDALLRFADCLSGVLANAGQLKEEAVADEEELVAEEVRRIANLLSPASKPPMIDLSALDNLEIASAASTPYRGRSLASRSPSMLSHWPPVPGEDQQDIADAVSELQADILEAFQQELYAEALSTSASRLMVEEFAVGRVSVLLDLHISEGSRFAPFAIDTHGTPLSLPRIGSSGLLFRPSIMLQGLLAHYAAEALLNAPAVLGSLELFLNPTGLVHSVGQGVEDLISLPMAALQAGSPAQFIAGLGLGSASLLRHFSGWTLTSISGFSSAFSRVLQKTLSSQKANRTVVPIRRGRGGIAEGLQGLAHGFSSGLTGIYRSPAAGYGSGSSGGLAVGVGRGLLGAVGLPLSGALDLVSSVSAGIASSTGITHARKPGQSGVLLGDEKALPSSGRINSVCRDATQKKNGMHECFRIALLKLERSGTETERHEGAFLVLGLDRLTLINTSANRILLDIPLQDVRVCETADQRDAEIRVSEGRNQSTNGMCIIAKLECPTRQLIQAIEHKRLI